MNDRIEKYIHTLEVNRDANKNHPKFVEACDAAITALKENPALKNRCYVLSRGGLCIFCRMECYYNEKTNSCSSPDLTGQR